MKTAIEVQRAHNLLAFLLAEEMEHRCLSDRQICILSAYISVLCWLLGHQHNDSFAQMLASIENQLRERCMRQ